MDQKKIPSSREFRCIVYISSNLFSANMETCCPCLLCVKSQRIQAVERTVLTWVLTKNHSMLNKRDILVREGCPEQRFMVLSDRAGTFTNTGCFKLMRWQPRRLKNAAVPTLGRILSTAKIGIQELELLKASIVYRLLQLPSCNLSESRTGPL